MGKKKPQQEVTEYYMSIHFGICSGPVDFVKRVLVGEKEAWKGFVSTVMDVFISNYKLFGGLKKEGGVAGSLYVLPGASDQLMPQRICDKYGLTQNEMPAYRGMATGYFLERPGAARKGFYWTANSPYLQGVWITVQRLARGLNDLYAGIGQFDLSSWVPAVNTLRASASSSLDYVNDFRNGLMVSASSNHIKIWKDPNYAATLLDFVDSFGSPQSVVLDDGGDVICCYQSSGVIRIFNSTTGALRKQLTLAGSFFDNAGILAVSVPEILGFDSTKTKTFGFRWGSSVKAFMGSGSVWAEIPGAASPGVSFLVGTQAIAAGRHAIYGVYGGLFQANDGRIAVIPFDETGCGTPVAADISGDIGAAEIHRIDYNAEQDVVVIATSNGGFFVYDSLITTLLKSSTGAPWSSSLESRGRMISGPDTATFRVNIPGAKNGIATYSISTGSMLSLIPAEDVGLVSANDSSMYWSAVDNTVPTLLVGGGLVVPVWSIPSSADIDANPAHIIFECLTNKSWGLGCPTSLIDVAGFEAIAVVLYNEQFGLSMQWVRQTTVEAFIQEVIDHIEATLFVNPRTGLLTLKLIRDDYVIDDLPVFTPVNSNIANFKRKLFGETINEIIVDWTDPANEESSSIMVQDGANIAIQGDIISTTKDYYGVRTAALATKLGYRDLRVASAPLASCDIEMDRSAWDLLPGGVCVIQSPEDEIEQLVMRVGPIDYGKAGSPMIKATLTEDVFSLATAQYSTPGGSAWVDSAEDPTPPDFQYAFTMPYFFDVNSLDPGVLSGNEEYPTVFAAVLAAEDGFDTSEFELIGDTTDTVGNPISTSLGTKDIVSHAVLDAALIPEVTSVIPATLVRTQGDGPSVGSFIIIGSGAETDQEIVVVTAVDTVDVTVLRGVLDTTPKDWPIGTPIWYLRPGLTFFDNTSRSAAEVVTYEILPITSRGELDAALTDSFDVTLTERPHLPSRPAGIAVNGVAFPGPLLDLDGVNPIPIVVAERNRLTEDAVVLAWDAATVTPEVGQTWQLVLMQLDRTPITTIAGLTGTSYDLDPASFAGATAAIIRFEAERDGLVSLQGFEVSITLSTGYGLGYGYNYGGA